jgi:hypothetical protein
VNRIPVCRVGARQREDGAEEGAKARWAVDVDPRLCGGGPFSATSLLETRGGTYRSATRRNRFWMREAKDVA